MDSLNMYHCCLGDVDETVYHVDEEDFFDVDVFEILIENILGGYDDKT